MEKIKTDNPIKLNTVCGKGEQTILIAEDQLDSLLYLYTILIDKGYRVAACCNGKEALKLFDREVFDLVITDLKMPELDGFSLLKSIKVVNPLVPVIIISGQSDTENIVKALRLGACDYIKKPYEVDEVYESIDRLSLTKSTRVLSSYNYLISETRYLEVDNNPAEINYIARFLCRDLVFLELEDVMQSLVISLIEALNNALFHGNLEMSSKAKAKGNLQDIEDYIKIAKKRAAKPPFDQRKIRIWYKLDREKVQYSIRDDGDGFDYRRLSNPQDPKSYLDLSGRGLLLIRTFCDEVFWNEKGNEITLIKYRWSGSKLPSPKKQARENQ